MICRRSLATLAVFFFSPSRNERNEAMSAPSEQPLQETLLLRVDEPQRLVGAQEAIDDILVRLGHVAALHVDRRRALVAGLQHALALGDDADQRDAQDVLDVLQ